MALFKWRKAAPVSPSAEEIQRLLLRELEQSDADWLWETDAQRRIRRVTPRFASACGIAAKDLNGALFLQILAGNAWATGQLPPGLRELAERLKAGEHFRDLLVPVLLDSEERWWELSASPRFDEQGELTGFIGVGTDVTDKRASADKINRLARFDQVTGLPNRLLVTEAMNMACEEAENSRGETEIRVFAITNLKELRSGLGYAGADKILKDVANKLSRLSVDNAMIGQLSSGEFTVVWRDATNRVSVSEFSKQFEVLLTEEVLPKCATITMSSGFAKFPEDGRNGEALITVALDRAYGAEFGARASNGRRRVAKAGSEGLGVQADMDGVSQQRKTIITLGPAASAGLDILIEEGERRLHNGPPEPINSEAIDRIRQLKLELERLIFLAETNSPLAKQLSAFEAIAHSVFRFSKETGEIFIAGLKPFLASVPTALGTAILIQSICAPAIASVVAPGAALAILAGYFQLDMKRSKSDERPD